MTSTDRSWHERWREARARHYASAAALSDAIRQMPGCESITRWTALHWELPRASNGSRPSPRFRDALATLNQDFAALIAELPTAAETRAQERDRVRRLEKQVEDLATQVREILARLDADESDEAQAQATKG